MKTRMHGTAHPLLKIKDPKGTVHQVEFRQFVLNRYQQFACLGFDRGKIPIAVEPITGIDYTFIGKLSEQGTIFHQQVINSLLKDDWDFEKYPNPEILLITDKRVAN